MVTCKLPPPPFEISPHSARQSPPLGGGDYKGISRQTVVPSNHASKQNTGEATWVM